MSTIDNQAKKDLLSTLEREIKYFSNSIESYFNQVGDHEVLNPARAVLLNAMGMNELIPPEFFAGFGIRRITLNESHGRLSLSDQNFIEIVKNNLLKYKWHEFKDQSIIEDLKSLFKNTRIIEFSDWANVYDVSDTWDNLRRDVIQPLNRKDFDFIFDLRGLTKRSIFDVGEVLDIISDFSLCGRVSLLLDADNAVQLWAGLNGLDPAATSTDLAPVGLREVYRYIFDALHIQHSMHAPQLLICTGDRITLFCEQQKFELAGRAVKNLKASENARHYFIAGYSVGLLLQLEISICIALGMAVSGAYFENRVSPDLEALLSYIERWMEELEIIQPQERLAV